MSRSKSSLDQIFQAHIQTLALTLRRDTVTNYRCVARRFLCYLHTAFPQLRRLSQLRRDPHLLGWFRWLCEQDPPLSNKTRGDYLLGLRRLLDDLTANGHSIQSDLIRREDFPPRPQYLPRPLSPEDDRLLQQERNFAGATTCRRMRSCSPAPPASASANASIFRWTVCGSSDANNGHCIFPLANCTPNVWCRSMKKDDGL